MEVTGKKKATMVVSDSTYLALKSLLGALEFPLLVMGPNATISGVIDEKTFWKAVATSGWDRQLEEDFNCNFIIIPDIETLTLEQLPAVDFFVLPCLDEEYTVYTFEELRSYCLWKRQEVLQKYKVLFEEELNA